MTELLVLVVFLGLCYLLNQLLFEKPGYRRWHSYFGGPSGYDPDPKQKEPLQEYWESNGYRWSERYHRWYLPKKRETTKKVDQSYPDKDDIDPLMWM